MCLCVLGVRGSTVALKHLCLADHAVHAEL